MLNEANFTKLCGIIYRRSGIYIDEKKYNNLKPKLEALFLRFQYEDFRSFFHDLRFQKSDKLMQEIMNTITVNETYFYREAYQFTTLVKDVLPALHAQKPASEPIRILCAPTSTGEEPYSMALALIDDDTIINSRDIEIIGLDIDSTVIKKAQNGFFSKRSVQFVPDHLLKRYFKEKNGGYQIDNFLRDAINFRVANVMDRYALKRLGKFDVIFCRNMLIYFDDMSRKEVAMSFYELLNYKGSIFLGHAESMNRIASVFKTAKSNGSIYYIKE